MRKNHLVLASLLLFTCAMFMGCASTSQTSKDTPSGFLTNYPPFQPGPADGVDKLYTKPWI